MNRKSVLKMAAVAIAILLCACNADETDPQTSANRRDTVVIKAMSFEPATITVMRGDTVVWINEDIVAHDVSSYPDREWHSDTLARGDSYEKVIEDSASYFCSIHPTMKGRVEVE